MQVVALGLLLLLLPLPLPPTLMLVVVIVLIFLLGWPFEWPAIVLIFLPTGILGRPEVEKV